MNIAVVAKKGGVGKSTVSLLLYEAFRNAHRTALIEDWDPQGTSAKTLAIINGHKPPPGEKAEITVWDTPPSLDHVATATAVRKANIIVVVTSPAPADVWETKHAVDFAREKNPKAPIRIIFNKFRKSTLLGKLIEDTSKSFDAPTLATTLSERECYRHAIGQGWKALDNHARQEVLQLAVELLSFESR
jgi:cellulose biosynthesis protein BcsQ